MFLKVFRNLSFALTCWASLDVSLTPVLTAVQCIILIQRKTGIGELVYLLKSPLDNVECIVVTTAAITIWTIHHAD